MKRIATLMTAILLIVTMFSACGRPEGSSLTAADYLDLGEKYLLEMNYEQALVQFLKAIEIEPMNPRGYTGAAEASLAPVTELSPTPSTDPEMGADTLSDMQLYLRDLRLQ